VGKDEIVPLSWQLNITQWNLLFYTIQLYSREALSYKTEFEAFLHQNENQPTSSNVRYHSYENCRKLSNMIHHFAHAVEYLHQNNNYYHNSDEEQQSSIMLDIPSLREIEELRKEKFYLLIRNYELMKRVKESQQLSYTSDDLEVVKSIVIAGQHLLHDQLTLTHEERLKVIHDYLLPFLQFLFPLVHSKQSSSLQMIHSNIYLEESLLYINRQEYELALPAIEKSLLLLEETTKESGNHILLQGLLVKGNILSLVNRYQKANEQYEKCLEIIQSFQTNRLIDSNEEKEEEEKTSDDDSAVQFKEFLIQIYYNYGISLIQSSSESSLATTSRDGTTAQPSVVSNPSTAVHKRKEKGEKLLRKALSLLQPQNNPEEQGGETELDSNHRVIVERISHFLKLNKK
jgi:tetratricopeptide (TPR) repeat protein